jgi:hypothetical protein
MVALRLAKAGYAGGDPERVLRMRADIVVSALQYEAFVGDFEKAYIELNREENR